MSETRKIPVIGFYIQRMAWINEAEHRKNYYDMFRQLLITTDTFQRQDREKCSEARTTLEKFIRAVDLIRGRTPLHTMRLRNQKVAELYYNGGREVKQTIYDTMWEGNYVTKEAFNAFFDPSGGRKSGR